MPLAPRLVVALSLMGLVSACQPPEDPEGTTDKVAGEVLILGWVAGVPQAGAPEIEVATKLAEALDADLRVVEDDIHSLVGALEEQRIHAFAGAVPKASPLSSHYGTSNGVARMTFSGEKTDRIIAVHKGENGFLMRLNTLIEAPQ